MKKSLLVFVVASLTIVGCQNYDDQFDDLNRQITGLATQVGELSGLSAQVQAVGDRVTALESATAQELAEILGEVSGLQAQLASIETVSEEVDNLNEEVDDIIAALNELLEQASIIQQDIVITSTAQLEYVENLMGLDAAADNTFVADESREYIVSGNITVDAEFVEDAAIGTRLNNVLARIASVITPDDGTGVRLDSGSSATAGTALVMTSMAFVQGGVSLEGANAIDTSALAALTATLTLDQGGAIAFPALNQVGNVRITATSTITSIDFSTVSTGGVIETAAGSLSNAALSGAVNLGKLDLPASVNLAKATSIIAGGAPNGVTISAPKATSISLVDTTPFAVTGAINITAGGDVTMNASSITQSLTIDAGGAIALNDLTSVSSETTLTASTTIHLNKLASNTGSIVASASEFHVPALATNSAALTVTATALDLSAFKTNTATATFTTATAINMSALTSNTSVIDAPAAVTFVADALSATGTSSIDVKTGAAITLKNLTATNTLADFGNLLTLTLGEQESNIDFSSAASMTTLNYTGKLLYKTAQGQQTNQVTITASNAKLTALNIGDGYIGTLHVNGSSLTAITTAGKIVNTQIANNAALATISFGHDHLSGEFAATVEVTGNGKIEALDLSTINKVKSVTVTGNSSLTALTMAGFSPAAEPGAAINVTIGNNKLAASYATAIAGSETTPYSDASLTDTTGLLCAVSDFINFYAEQEDRSATNTPTLSINLKEVTDDAATPVTATLSATLSGDTAAQAGIDGTAGNADDETDGGAIDTIAELNAIVDSCS
jgi:prefoldin subunit 5